MSVSDYIALVTAVGAIISTTAVATWFLARQFSKHEDKDNRRHIENIKKFSQLALQIAKLRWHLKIPDTGTESLTENGGQ